MYKVHAFRDDALADHDAVELAKRIRTGVLSPLDVVHAAIARARLVEPRLNAIALDTFEAALAAAGSPGVGPFAGVPTFFKDVLQMEGLPTNLGTRALNAKPAKKDELYAKNFLAQGFISLGKSAMSELGFNATNEPLDGPPTRNPWDVRYTSGASSAGAAALVASGVVPLAHGNDGGGSVRIPAACCGLVGLKPTRGRVPAMLGARGLPLAIVSEGVLTRSVRDTAHFYAAAERIYANSTLPPIGLVESPGKKRLHIGLVLDSVTGHVTDDETRAAVCQAATLLQDLGHRVEVLTMPEALHGFAKDFLLYWGMLAFLSKTFGKVALSWSFTPSRLDNLSHGLARMYRTQMSQTPGMLRRLKQSQQQYAEAFADWDAVLSPVVGQTTPELGYLSPAQDFDTLLERLFRFVCFTPLNNATGSPAIALPIGKTQEGLPIGVHLSAAHGAERTLLELAYELEQAQPWRRIQDERDGHALGRDEVEASAHAAQPTENQ